MAHKQTQFAQLMQEVLAGSEEAAHQLLEMYGTHIQKAVRRRLHRKLRSKFDSQDFVQAVWTSFYKNLSRVKNIDRPEALLAFLTRIAGNKVIDECRKRLKSKKHNINREISIDESEKYLGRSLNDPGPSPSQCAIANEQWDNLLEGHPLHYADILRLRASGATHKEIADTLGIAQSTVRRALKKVSDRYPHQS